MTVVRRLVFLTLFTIAWCANAQPGPGNPGEDPDAVPITGLEYLLIGGGAYGVSRILKNRKGGAKEEGK